LQIKVAGTGVPALVTPQSTTHGSWDQVAHNEPARLRKALQRSVTALVLHIGMVIAKLSDERQRLYSFPGVMRQ
jgi:hypothetical protein